MNPSDTVYVIDTSLSMGRAYYDFVPNKLAGVVNLVSKAAARKIQVARSRVGLVVFYGQAYPLLPPTDDPAAVMRALSVIKETREGSALGDAVIEAAKLLRGSHRRREIIVLTDGDLNMGAPFELSVIYASGTGARLCFITMGQRDRVKVAAQLAVYSKSSVLEWRHAETMRDAMEALFDCSGVKPESG